MEKTVFITGATSGIGRAAALLLGEKGCRIVACGRRETRLEELAGVLGDRMHPLVFDVRDRAAVRDAVDSLPEAFSQVDVLINNAGNAHGLDRIQEGDPDDWDAMIDINASGILSMAGSMIKQG